jgi:choline-sulfatase
VNLEGDNTVHTYIMRADWSRGHWEGPWKQFGIGLGAQGPVNIDILSISITPKVAKYSVSTIGVTSEQRNNVSHPSLHMYTPGRLSYRVKIPNEGRLDFGLGVLRNDSPVNFRSTIKHKGREEEIVFEEIHADEKQWIYRSVDLSSWRNRKVTLALETDAECSGTIAFWAKPTIWRKRNDRRPNFMVIVLDALRADHMGTYGYYRNTAPNIEKMLNHCIIFKNAYSQAAATPGSTASLFTSTYVSAHGVTMPGNPAEGLPIIDRLPTLAEVLRENGYYTKAISVTDWVSVETGYGKGFEDFELVDLPASWDRRLNEAQITTECIIDFLGGDLRRPFFLYVHMHGSHWPYDPPEKFNIFQNKVDPLPPNIAKLDTIPVNQAKDFLDQLVNDKKLSKEDLKYLIDRYDGAIYQNDSALKEVFNEIREQGLYENTMIIITADHGDQLMEHGWIGHWRPYNDTLHVPLIINYPPLFENRNLRDYIVETIGIGPTILAQAGIEKPATFKGDDLFVGKSKDYAVTEGITWWKIQNLEWSLVYRKQEKAYELYDLRNDPGEFHNIADQHDDIVKMMESQMKGEIQTSITKIKKVPLDPKTIERLKALGYFN